MKMWTEDHSLSTIPDRDGPVGIGIARTGLKLHRGGPKDTL